MRKSRERVRGGEGGGRGKLRMRIPTCVEGTLEGCDDG